MDRRHFIKTTAASAAALSVSARSWAQVAGANGDIRVGVVGFRGRGRSHIEGFRKLDGVRVVALCDVDMDVLDREARKFANRNEPIETFTDVRMMLERDDLDVIATATPNHWHALISIWACQAGKDVYVEKPVSHNVREGRLMVEAARKHGRIVQTGTQSRSNPGMRDAIAWLHAGNLGRIKVARGLCYKRRKSIGKVNGAQPIPPSIDYDLWCGPAPKTPLRRTNLHYDWHWDWPTGNGDLGNQGIHQMDIARWALNEKALSPAVFSCGGRFGYDDDGTTANTQIVYHAYENAPLIFEVRGLGRYAGNDGRPAYRGASVGVVVDCEDGYMVIPTYDSAIAYSHAGEEIKRFKGGADHFANFIDGVRSRSVSQLNADILDGHLSSALCHTGNISHQLGGESSAGEILDAVRGDSLAAESVGRMLEHLEVNEIDFNATRVALGPMLRMNPETERFFEHRRANQMLTRDYRAPFVVPERV